MESDKGTGSRWEAYRPSKTLYGWSIVGAVVATIVVGFAWGGWVTGGSAKAMAADAAAKARVQLAAAFCVGKVTSSPDARSIVASVKAEESYNRGDVVAKGGWATLPGQERADSDVADACAQKLASITLPPASEATASAKPDEGGNPTSPQPATKVE